MPYSPAVSRGPRQMKRRVMRTFALGRSMRFACGAVLLMTRAYAADGVADGSRRPAGYGLKTCQVAELSNGFAIRYERQEAAGPVVRLWLCAGEGVGYVDVPAEQIDHFEEGPVAQSAPAAPASPPETASLSLLPAADVIGDSIARAAARYRIDPDFVASVVRAESGFDPNAVSPKGAQGLMQLMPQTAATLGVGNVFDPAANVEGGTRYLRQLLDQYGGDAVKALAAYNAGPGRVEQYRGIPPYRETWDYVTRIIEDYNRKKVRQQARATAEPGDK